MDRDVREYALKLLLQRLSMCNCKLKEHITYLEHVKTYLNLELQKLLSQILKKPYNNKICKLLTPITSKSVEQTNIIHQPVCPLEFGYSKVKGLNVAEVEKAVLDIAYITLPQQGNLGEWKYILTGLLKPCRIEKLRKYLPKYPKHVREAIKHTLKIT